MIQTVTISSKRQITIPASLFKSLQLKEGDTLSVKIEDNQLVLQKKQDILNQLAGSLKTPDKYKNLSVEEIIDQARQIHYTKNYTQQKNT